MKKWIDVRAHIDRRNPADIVVKNATMPFWLMAKSGRRIWDRVADNAWQISQPMAGAIGSDFNGG